jgi:hypothetical protein
MIADVIKVTKNGRIIKNETAANMMSSATGAYASIGWDLSFPVSDDLLFAVITYSVNNIPL